MSSVPAGKDIRQGSIPMDSNQPTHKKSIIQGFPAITDFNPCTATASMLLYAQGTSIICAHHDTLAIERRFSRHLENILLLAADTISDRGAGKWVVSYDASKTGIFWDCLTGDELTRFTSHEILTAIAWIRNGSLVFGNINGDILLFDPITVAFSSTHTIDDTPITAIAPGADCKTFAIGFANGLLIIALLVPKFTIMYNLSTEESACSITTLAWHASSSRQKSDMLATQYRNGEIRVWSIPKFDQLVLSAKVIRIIQRSENPILGSNWLSWSKNGRIIQFSEGETLSWDVRTKNLTYETVPTLEHVRGLAIYGSGASLFTLGPNNTVQQFDLNSPPQMVANVQHLPDLASVPFSTEQKKKGSHDGEYSMDQENLTTIPARLNTHESENQIKISSLKLDKPEMRKRKEPKSYENSLTEAESPVSYRSQKSMNSQSSMDLHQKNHTLDSSGVKSQGCNSNLSPSLHSSHETSFGSSRDNLSISSIGSRSDNSASFRSPNHRCLRKVKMLTSESKLSNDIFAFTRKRLEKNLKSSSSQVLKTAYLSNQDCQRQMFRIIFGWNGGAHELIQDEIDRHSPRSSTRLLLAKWLGKIDSESITSKLEPMNSSDWMLLALNSMGRHTLQINLSQAYIQRLLGAGDIHTAATIMIGMGDPDDAIEIYVSHKSYMEAIILTCLVFPDDWPRQAQLIQRWGEFSIQCDQINLAARCLNCIGLEHSEAYFSIAAKDTILNLPQNSQNIPNILSPPVSPPELRGPQRNISREFSLKINTSFSNHATSKSSSFRTKENISTPILSASSLVSSETAQTEFIRSGQRSAYHTPASARTATPNGFKRQYIPPSCNVAPNIFSHNTPISKIISSPVIELEQEKDEEIENISFPSQINTNQMESIPVVERSTMTSPMIEKPRNFLRSPLLLTFPPEFSSSISQSFDLCARNGSYNHEPQKSEMQWPPMESIITGDYMISSNSSVNSSRSETLNRSLTKSHFIDTRSESNEDDFLIGQYISHGYDDTEIMGHVCKSLDAYISSLESDQSRENKKEIMEDYEERSDHKKIDLRGLDKICHVQSLRSVSDSPVFKSSDKSRDKKINCDNPGEDSVNFPEKDAQQIIQYRFKLPLKKGYSRASVDISSSPTRKISARRLASFKYSHQPTADDDIILIDNERSRSRSPKGSIKRSPSLFTWSHQDSYENSHNSGDNLKQTSLEYIPYSTPHNTSSAQGQMEKLQDPEINSKNSTNRRDIVNSESQGKCESLNLFEREILHRRTVSDANVGGTRSLINDRNLRKEKAARELEERRKSLARRPSVPQIIHPHELEKLSPAYYKTPPPSSELIGKTIPELKAPEKPFPGAGNQMIFEEEKKKKARIGIQIGLPATPKAMKILKSRKNEATKSWKPSSWSTGKYEIMQSYAGEGISSAFHSNDFENLTILPSTTYKANTSTPSRRMPPRSASAPIPEEPLKSPLALPSDLPTHPAFQVALPPSSGRHTADPNTSSSLQWHSRKVSPGESQPGTLGYEIRNNQAAHGRALLEIMSGIEETMEITPPSSPKVEAVSPPLLKELQHLARPPPPPPPPPPPVHFFRPENPNTNSIVSAISSGSGIIEIVHDDQDESCADQNSSDPRTFSISPSPSPKQSSYNGSNLHNQNRSENDCNTSGRFTRITERIRSVSRGQGIIHSISLLEAKNATISMPIRSVNNSPVENINHLGGNNNLVHEENNLVNHSEVLPIGIEGGMI